MEKNISTIIFDFGNVIIDLDLHRFEHNFHALLGIPQGSDLAKERAIYKIIASYERGQINTEVFINRIIKSSPQSVQALDVIQCWNSMLVGIKPEKLSFLKDLKKKYQLYILSNTNPLHIEWVHKHLTKVHNVDDFGNHYLHGVFYSHELKMAKPEPRIYHSVQLKLDIQPEEIFFIDDREENIQGARDAGWTAAIHDPGLPLRKTLHSILS